MSRMPRRKRKEFMENSDYESQDEGLQDEGFGSSTSTAKSQYMPHKPHPRSQLNLALKASGNNAPAFKWFTENPFLVVLLLGSLTFDFFLYKKVNILEFNFQMVLEKNNQLGKKFSILFSHTQTYSESIKKIGDIIQKSNNKIDDISLSVGFIGNDIKVIENNITIIDETLKKEKSALDVLTEEIENVKSEQENSKAMQGDKEDKACLNSFIKIRKKDVEVSYTNISTTNDDVITGSVIVYKLKQVDGTVQKKQEEIPDIMNMNKEDVSAGIEDKWSWIQRTTPDLVLIAFFTLLCLLFYKKIDGMVKQIKYLAEYKDKPSLKFKSFCIVDQIKRRQREELENKFCVISFSQETHNKHRRITRSSVEGRLRIKNMDEADYLVTNDKSVLNIPPCKVLLVFVDHNYHCVILENPIKDGEDIKLLTVQACRKMGADVFVIYVGDEGSESLGCLYNPKFTTVEVHFELKQLAQRERLISCYEKFTKIQREKVAQAIA